MLDFTGAASFDDGPLAPGARALERGAWDDAAGHFRAALAEQDTPEGWEGLAVALWWRNDLDAAFDARERAYPLYRARGDRRAAARVAIWLAWDYLGARGQRAVANGWLQRAHSLLDDLQPGSEHGWLALREAENAILWAEDPVTARALAARGIALGRALGQIDLEMYGLALEGFAMVSEGEVPAGMRRLDEATTAAVGGEMRNRTAIGSTCCCLIFACERVYDYDRAMQWCDRLKDYCERIGYVPLLGVCRSHHAGVLLWAGAWGAAEDELTEAAGALQATRPGFAAEAVARLGFLRYRQGRLDEAVALFEQARPLPAAHLGLGWLALDLGEAETALDHAERYLRRIPRENRTERAPGLELLTRAQLALGALPAAQDALDELTAIAGLVGTGPLLAIANSSAGALAAAGGDHARAHSLLEDAVDLFGRSGAPFEMAQARLALAASLEALGRLPAAAREAQAALDAFQALGAARAGARAAALLQRIRRLPPPQAMAAPGPPALSARQKEVLALIAQGLSDAEIAGQLTLSPHTVHRHVTNILDRLDVRSRAAAIAYATREGLL
jgi:LuxR family transcriptional regulator, maltose regulon positive regulatory protein